MKQKVADYIIQYLADLGIDKIFVVYGSANGDLIDAFVRVENTDYVCVMNEQGGGFAAEGYAKTSGKFGVAIATSGPGATNFVTSIGNCFYDSVPCLFLTGQISTKFLRPSEEIRQIGFQEGATVDVVKPICKYATMIKNGKSIKYELEKALYLMESGRPGPVLLDLPLDIQKEVIETDDLIGYNTYVQPVYDDRETLKQVKQYIRDLKQSKRPVLMIGNGVKLAGATIYLLKLCDTLKIPVFPTWNAIDTVPSDYKYYCGRIGTYGGPGRNFGIQNSDLLLAIGSRISGRITGGNVNSFARKAKKYMVDVDEGGSQAYLQQVPFDECILSDAKLFISLLLNELVYRYRDIPDFTQWVNRCLDWKNKYDPIDIHKDVPTDDVNPYLFMKELSNQMTPKDVILGDCGGNIVIMSHSFQTKGGQVFITNNGNSPMGFSMCAAMGAQMGHQKDGNVVCVIGDGGMILNIQELQTIKNYNIPVKVFILNNEIYGITQAFQQVNFEGRCEACGPKGYKPPYYADVIDGYRQ
jgi:acetolactate synthase-1/2/3 large subunit